jgi:hypothetical protein
MPLVAKRSLRALHEIHQTAKQSVEEDAALIALCNKLIRILFGILKKDMTLAKRR